MRPAEVNPDATATPTCDASAPLCVKGCNALSFAGSELGVKHCPASQGMSISPFVDLARRA